MRSEEEMYRLILDTAKKDDRIRAVILSGSRANPNARRDRFQDFDIVYLVTDVAPFRTSPSWIGRFGELMILQTPEDMQDPPPAGDGAYVYLMQFTDGTRIDLTLHPLPKLHELQMDSLSVPLLDKDGVLGELPPPDERDYMPVPPTAKAFSDCCNEFWWCCPYVAKGLWRGEILYAKHVMERFVREQLMKMLTWHIGVRTGFTKNPGTFGKHFGTVLEPGMWDRLLLTWADAGYEATWDALEAMCGLFREASREVAGRFDFEYPRGDDERVSAHLAQVRSLAGPFSAH